MKQNNIILIGMPGCGKSTLGVVLAKLLCRDFADVDLLIQRRIGMTLQQYIDQRGTDAFLEAEADALEALCIENAVIATGGSAPLTKRGAARLKALGKLVFLDVPCAEIEKRVTDAHTRGIAMAPGETLRTVYEKRYPVYKSLADLTVSLSCQNIAAAAQQLAERLGEA